MHVTPHARYGLLLDLFLVSCIVLNDTSSFKKLNKFSKDLNPTSSQLYILLMKNKSILCEP